MRFLLAAAILALMWAVPASAAEVVMVKYQGPSSTPGLVTAEIPELRAAPGEANDVTITFRPDTNEVDFSDAAGPLTTPGSGCVASSSGVTCKVYTSASAHLGDGDDRLTVRGGDEFNSRAGAIFGEEGDDRLVALDFAEARFSGGPGADTLIGGQVSSLLAGGLDSDVLQGGGDDDILAPDADMEMVLGISVSAERAADQIPFANDTVDGGGSSVQGDQMDYEGRTTPVNVDLAAGTAGSGGEVDRISSVDGAIGTPAADRLKGNDRRGNFDTGGGNDRVFGGGGADTLKSRGGSAHLSGGPGNDELIGPRTTRFDCGAGARDTVAADVPMLKVPRNCERIEPKFGFANGEGEAYLLDYSYLSNDLQLRGEDIVSQRVTIQRGATRDRVYRVTLRQPKGEHRKLGGADFIESDGAGEDVSFEVGFISIRLNALGRRVAAKGDFPVLLVFQRVGYRDRLKVFVTVDA